ncbi:hypothetical protein MPTK1_7g06010 [Marchantia polymorpha subsp. ruderalis]|nr:hypothetical protein MARPO_0057s0070 [Marchantia polymorpha]BBN16407.1 hypothetical protein Mp_7g06010 [Marchantia polymorpha subsp. ruderalis]|eukprot:PTQ37435.1 hypothetical protein MARPO_0057s0070 [Marchantia polymorpha]
MNFLRSGLFSDSESRPPHATSGEEEEEAKEAGRDDGMRKDEQQAEAMASPWSFGFGSLVKTLASKSGEVLQAYQRDLHEFADGLKKETEVVAEVTVHAVKDLPHTLETGAVVAQESLETVGQTLEDFGGSIWRGTTELIASVKEAVQKVDEEAAANSKAKANVAREASATPAANWKYNRYEAQVNAMQRDSSTYCDEPEDEDDFAAWRSSFRLSEKQGDIEAVTKDNAFMQELQARIVPLIVEHEVFWTRYFYRLHKLQQVEDARADLVKRATLLEDEELTWDVEEDLDDLKSPAEPRSEGAASSAAPAFAPAPAIAAEPVASSGRGKEVAEREVAGPASPSGSGVKAEHHQHHQHQQHPEIAPEASAGIPDEESVSEGSTGSDWLVVQDEKDQGAGDDGAQQKPGKEAVPSVVGKGRQSADEADEPELEDIGDIAVDAMPRGSSDSSKSNKVVDKKPVADETEDWGDWE